MGFPRVGLELGHLDRLGFVAVLSGAVAQRFLASEIEDVADATAEVEVTEAEVLTELREVRARLERLEARLAPRGG